MPKSKWAQLSSNLPDDQIEENGQIVRLGGFGVSEAIAHTLKDLGFVVEGPLEAGFNGWELYPVRGKLKAWMQISDMGGGVFLLGSNELRLFCSARRRRWFVDEFLVPFNEALRKNEAFTDIAWVDPRDAPQAKGAYSPADPSVPEC